MRRLAAVFIVAAALPGVARARDVQPSYGNRTGVQAPGAGERRAGVPAPIEVLPGDGGVLLRAAESRGDLSVRLRGVSIGGQALAIDAAAPPITYEDAVEYARGAGVIESYAALAGGVEQTFRIEAPPFAPDGELVIALEASLDGVPASVLPYFGGYRILPQAGGGGFRMSLVTVIDAALDTFPAHAVARGPGRIEFVLAAPDVARVAWPIVVDPFIDFFAYFAAPFTLAPNIQPDVAYAEGRFNDSHLIAWQHDFGTDFDVMYQIFALNPISGVREPALTADIPAAFSAADEGRPRVAFMDDGVFARYLIAYHTDFFPDFELFLNLVDADGTFIRSRDFGLVDPNGFNLDELNPVVGSDPETGQFLVVFEVDFITDLDIFAAKFDSSLNFLGLAEVSAERVVAGSPATGFFDQRAPAVTARPVRATTGVDAWIVAYEDASTARTQIVCAAVPTSTAAVNQRVQVNVPSQPPGTIDRKRPDVAASPTLPVALVAHVAEDSTGERDLQANLILWNAGAISNTTGLSNPNPNFGSPGAPDERPAVAHRFLAPSAGVPQFWVLYESAPSTATATIKVAEFLVSTTSPFSPTLLGEYVASRDLSNQTRVRAQFTDGGLIGFEEGIFVRETDDAGDLDSVVDMWTERVLTVAGQTDEDFDTQPTAIPAGALGLPWATSGTAGWAIQPATGNPSTSAAAVSGTVAASGNTSTLSITLTTIDIGLLIFDLKLSGLNTTTSGDRLTLRDNGFELGYWTGDQAFRQLAFFVSPGAHTFEWTLTRGPATGARTPVATIDNVSFPPVAPPSITSFTATPNPAAVNQAVTFTVVSSGVATVYTFDFDDGTPPAVTTNNSVTHTYTANGTFNPSVDVDGPGGFDTESIALTVGTGGGGGFTVTLAATPTSGNPPLTVQFTATVTGATPQAFAWNFGDGTPQQITPTNTTSHTYLASGDFDATVTVTPIAGGSPVTSNTVRVRARASGPSGTIGRSGSGGGGCVAGGPTSAAGVMPLAGMALALVVVRRRRG